MPNIAEGVAVFLEAAEKTYKSQNYEECYESVIRVLSIDAHNMNAWIYRAKALVHMKPILEIPNEEVSLCCRNAINEAKGIDFYETLMAWEIIDIVKHVIRMAQKAIGAKTYSSKTEEDRYLRAVRDKVYHSVYWRDMVEKMVYRYDYYLRDKNTLLLEAYDDFQEEYIRSLKAHKIKLEKDDKLILDHLRGMILTEKILALENEYAVVEKTSSEKHKPRHHEKKASIDRGLLSLMVGLVSLISIWVQILVPIPIIGMIISIPVVKKWRKGRWWSAFWGMTFCTIALVVIVILKVELYNKW